jgi:hypothetical protein
MFTIENPENPRYTTFKEWASGDQYIKAKPEEWLAVTSGR